MKKLLLFLLFTVSFGSFGQQWNGFSLMTQVGITASVGTHSTRLGLTVSGHLNYSFVQLNVSNFANFNLFGYGKRAKFWESRTALGVVFLGGKRNNTPDFQLDALMHNTTYSYGIGYNYLWYHDNVRTSQRSGGFALHVKKMSVLMENDLFAGLGKDRFRTGHLTVTYRYQTSKFTLGLNVWTGETAKSTWEKITSRKCPSGFRYLDELPYGKTSHGILYLGVTTKVPYVSNAYAKLGVDSEHIRHVVQNRLMHDLLLLPKGFPRNTPHYPMLDQEGCPTFEKSLVRRSKLYLQGGINDVWSN